MMNKVVLVGRLTRDPETRQAGETTVPRISIAVDRRYKHDGGQTADFPSVVAFGKTAEFIEKYFHKGMKIALEGRLQTGSYEKDGKRIYTTDVIAEAVEFAESKSADVGATTYNAWVDIPEGVEEELPF